MQLLIAEGAHSPIPRKLLRIVWRLRLGFRCCFELAHAE